MVEENVKDNVLLFILPILNGYVDDYPFTSSNTKKKLTFLNYTENLHISKYKSCYSTINGKRVESIFILHYLVTRKIKGGMDIGAKWKQVQACIALQRSLLVWDDSIEFYPVCVEEGVILSRVLGKR